MQNENPITSASHEIAIGLAALLATVVRAHLSRAPRPWFNVVLDAFVTTGLVYLSYKLLLALDAHLDTPVPDDVAIAIATMVGVLGWEVAVRVVRRGLGINSAD